MAMSRGPRDGKEFLSGGGDLDGLAVNLRAAAERDVDALARLDAAVFGSQAWPRQAWWETVCLSGWTSLVHEQDGRLAAAMVLVEAVPVAYLASVAVDAAYRRRGLGRALVREAVRRSATAGARWLSLEVDSDNASALRLYRDEGFGVLRRFVEDGRHRLEMIRRLARPRRLL